MRPTVQGRRLWRVLGATLIAGGVVVSMAGVANANVTASPAGPPSVTINGAALSVYPATTAPASCGDGPGFLQGTTFTVNDTVYQTLREGAGGPDSLKPGDVIVMHWTGFTGGVDCANAIGVSLAVKSANSPTFDPGADQALLLDFAYCGPDEGATPCSQTSPEANTLTLTMPNYDEAVRQLGPDANPGCDYQVDAVIGGPLAKVGPGGSFYNNDTRGDATGPNMLIDAANGGPGSCALVTKHVVANGAPAPEGKTYTICLTPQSQEAAPDVAADAVGCPEGSIQMDLKDGEFNVAALDSGTTYDVTEIIDGVVYPTEAQGPLDPFTPTDGLNSVTVNNIYQCPDGTPPDIAGYKVIIDVDCNTTTSSSIPTTPPPCQFNCNPCFNCDTTTTASTTSTTTSTSTTATTIATTTTVSRGEQPPPEVEGTTVAPPQTLPVTGSSMWPAARIGILMVLAGSAAIYMSRRRRVEA